MQALAEGGLSERARQRAAELANDADLRVVPPRAETGPPARERTSTKILRFEADDRLAAKDSDSPESGKSHGSFSTPPAKS